jgi:hypothetical protein
VWGVGLLVKDGIPSACRGKQPDRFADRRLNVAVGDLNGDGREEIITGVGGGGGPHVKAFDGRTGAAVRSFYAFHSDFAGGVRVSARDLDGDNLADILTAAGPGGGPHVRAFRGDDGAELFSEFAFDPAYSGGVYVG